MASIIIRDNDGFYTVIGIFQIFAAVFYAYALLVRVVYDVYNGLVIASSANLNNHIMIRYMKAWNYFTPEYESLSGFVVWLEQMVLGNKRMLVYANTMMGFTMMMHPITFIFAQYYIAQLPIEFGLDMILYPIYPMYDEPIVQWQQYWEE